ncbi:hypothetical protein J6590_078674 [Homalodisca vitripennis]|nr:hypothetical protein J6590_078674 [Homalodisca vitripennis]
MDDVLLEEAESVKFLAMYLDRGLTWDFHDDSICSKERKFQNSQNINSHRTESLKLLGDI